LQVTDSIAGGSDNTIATLHNFSDTGGDTRYAGLNFRIGSDNGTSAIRAYRTNTATNYETNLSFWTNPVGATQTPLQAMTIDSYQRVGIGTTSPRQALTFGSLTSSSTATPDCIDLGATYTSTSASTNLKFKLYVDSSGNTYGFTTNGSSHLEYYAGNVSSPGNHVFLTGGSERARIDSSGRLLVGTSDGSGGVSKLIVQGASNGSAVGVAQISYNGLASAGLGAGTDIGYLRFTDQGSNSGVFAQITATADATTGAGDYPGRLVFSTTSDGASSPTERLRITSAGNVGIGTTSPGSIFDVKPSASSSTLRIEAGTINSDSIRLQAGGTVNTYLEYRGYLGHAWFVDTTERARIDSSGRLLVGTSSARANFYNSVATSQFQVEGTTFENASASLTCNNASDTQVSVLVFARQKQWNRGRVKHTCH
jgi:hypothetical protein